jgi:hypothetical protein
MIQPTNSKNKRLTTSQPAISRFIVSSRHDSVAEGACIDIEGQNEAAQDLPVPDKKKQRIL